jgi:phosphopantothenoylcysteine decarboxylase/phosphopantothenate--cysteine ligase
LNDKGAGFGFDTNKVSIIDKFGKQLSIDLKSKTEVANEIVEYIAKKFGQLRRKG